MTDQIAELVRMARAARQRITNARVYLRKEKPATKDIDANLSFLDDDLSAIEGLAQFVLRRLKGRPLPAEEVVDLDEIGRMPEDSVGG